MDLVDDADENLSWSMMVAALTWLQQRGMLDVFKSFNDSCWLCVVAR